MKRLLVAVLMTWVMAGSASAHHASVTTKYYLVGDMELTVADVQEVWRAKLKVSAFDDETIEYLAYFNLLSPVYVDTDIDVGSFVERLEPLFVVSVAHGDMVPLNVPLLRATRGDNREGDVLEEIAAPYGYIDLTSTRAWFAVDSDGTLLVATDGAPVSFFVYELH